MLGGNKRQHDVMPPEEHWLSASDDRNVNMTWLKVENSFLCPVDVAKGNEMQIHEHRYRLFFFSMSTLYIFYASSLQISPACCLLFLLHVPKKKKVIRIQPPWK